MTTVIQLNNISKHFGNTPAVNSVSLDLQEGEFFALLGPSGCGKTTLLRLIAGFATPDTGHIKLDDNDMTSVRASQRPINLMFQSYALFPHMSVRANISYGLEMERLARDQINRRVDAMLDLTDLGALAQRKPAQLSGGQQQRVALARALVKQPRVLLLDEPLGALDKKLRGQMQIELKRFQHELGITFVVVTHDQEEALVMADRIALMNEGKIIQVATPSVLYEQPNSRFAADFIGDTNLFDGHASATGINIAGIGDMPTSNTLTPGTPCAVSIRPERVRIQPTDSGSDPMPLQGTITDIAYHGQDSVILIDLHASSATNATPKAPTRLAAITARIANDDSRASQFDVGQSVCCHWTAENARLVE